MRPTAALLLVLTASTVHAQEMTRLFTDEGKTYLRSDAAATLVPGTELAAFSDEKGTKSAGKVIVMEVTGQLARVTFDDDRAKASAKFVRVGGKSGAVIQSPPGLPPPPPPPPSAPMGVPPRPGPLQATLVRGGGYILIRNDSQQEWTGCKLDFPDRRWAPVAQNAITPGRSAQVGYGEIKPAPDLGDNWILVRCAEGEAEMYFDQPQKTNSLRGRAEGRGGGVILYNDGDFDWTQCELIKANGNRFAQGLMRAHSTDSVRAGLFRPPSGPEIITLTCAQGAVSKPVP